MMPSNQGDPAASKEQIKCVESLRMLDINMRSVSWLASEQTKSSSHYINTQLPYLTLAFKMHSLNSFLTCLLILILPIFMFPVTAVADTNDASDRATKPGKDLYTVFPKDGTDTSSTVEFIKSVIEDDDLHPLLDVEDHLTSWAVEATPGEVAELQNFDGIARVTKLEIAEHHPSSPEADSPTTQRYIIFPVDSDNLDRCDTTSDALKALFNDNVHKFEFDGVSRRWKANLTPDEARQARGVDGVKYVKRPLGRARKSRSQQEDPNALRKYTIFPTDGNNLERFNATDAALKALLGEKVDDRRGMDLHWVATLTGDEVELASGVDGVSRLKRVHQGYRSGRG